MTSITVTGSTLTDAEVVGTLLELPASLLHEIALYAYTETGGVMGKQLMVTYHRFEDEYADAPIMYATLCPPAAVNLSFTCKALYHAIKPFMITHMKVYMEHQKAHAHQLGSHLSYSMHAHAYLLAKEGHENGGDNNPLSGVYALQPPPYAEYMQGRNAVMRLERIDAGDGKTVVAPEPFKDYDIDDGEAFEEAVDWTWFEFANQQTFHDLTHDQCLYPPTIDEIPNLHLLSATERTGAIAHWVQEQTATRDEFIAEGFFGEAEYIY